MINKKNISRMYSKLSPSKSSVEKCLDCKQTQKVVSFPMKRVLFVAACITLLMAMMVTTVGAVRLFNAYDALDEYSQALPYPEKQGADNSLLHYSSSVAVGEKIVTEAQGLKVVAQESFYDGSMVCISFVGEYEGEYKDAFRFDYTDTEEGEEFLVEGKSVTPLYQGSFYMLKTEDKFSGILRLPFDGEKNEVQVNINIPYLQVSDEEYNVLGELSSDFNFNLTIEKSEEGVLAYTGDAISDDIYIQRIVSSAAGFKLEYFVPDSKFPKGANIQPVITDENGISIKLIEGRREEAEDGEYHVWRCEATTAESVNITLYDKNNTDGCEQEICVVADFTDIKLN